MGIPYYPYTSCKVGSFELGISLSEFMELVDKGEIEISDRGGKHPFVNNDTLESCILKYGGRQERYDEYIHFKTNLYQKQLIIKFGELAKQSSNISVNGFNNNEILDFYHKILLLKENQKSLDKLHSFGITDSMLSKYYEDENFDMSISKNLIKPIILKEEIGNATFTLELFHLFFKTYRSNLADYKNIDFLTKSQKQSIVKKAEQKFGY